MEHLSEVVLLWGGPGIDVAVFFVLLLLQSVTDLNLLFIQDIPDERVKIRDGSFKSGEDGPRKFLVDIPNIVRHKDKINLEHGSQRIYKRWLTLIYRMIIRN